MNLSDNEKIIIVLGASGDTGKYFVNYFLEECKNDSYKLLQLAQEKQIILKKLELSITRLILLKKKILTNYLPRYMLLLTWREQCLLV